MLDLTCVNWDYTSNKSKNKYLYKFFNLYKDMSIDMSFYNKAIRISDIDDFESELYLRKVYKSKILLYFKEDELVAYAIISPDTKNYSRYWLDELFISRMYRHRGYGSCILKSIISVLKKNKYKELFLQVSEYNKIAKHLYEKNGFVRYLDLKKLDLEYLTFINQRVYFANLS